MQRSLFDPAPEHDISRGAASPTSQAAHEALAPYKPNLRRSVLAVIQARSDRGASLEEVCEALAKPAHSLSGRISELQRDGAIKDSGRRRTNGRGNGETVWVAV